MSDVNKKLRAKVRKESSKMKKAKDGLENRVAELERVIRIVGQINESMIQKMEQHTQMLFKASTGLDYVFLCLSKNQPVTEDGMVAFRKDIMEKIKKSVEEQRAAMVAAEQKKLDDASGAPAIPTLTIEQQEALKAAEAAKAETPVPAAEPEVKQ